MIRTLGILALATALATASARAAAPAAPAAATADAVALLALPWGAAWSPEAGSRWTESWFLDGAQGKVAPVARGLELRAGPAEAVDEGHTVLWTRRSFAGDLRIDFRYTRLDDAGPGRNSVNILYFHARGSGRAPYDRDIFLWRDRRAVAAMRQYFEHMEACHISYSSYSAGAGGEQDYIRMRRYLPERGRGLDGTEVEPTYVAPGLFRTGVPHAFTVIRRGARVVLFVRDLSPGGAERNFAWDAGGIPLLDSGRIGLRHMAGRAARYEDFTVRTGVGGAAAVPQR